HDTIGSRLGKVVRVKEGLTYGINSGLGDVTVAGAPWKITVSVNPANIERTLSLINEVVAKYLEEGISERELADEKGRVYGEFVVSLRNTLGLARALNQYQSIGLGAAAMDTLESQYAAISKGEADAAMRKYFRLDQAVTVIAGTF
ncbi:MAG: insulinase family protein, partial [Candidatus Obscuribacterales bacterium]|nr:insulinase family protein [Candidatus Obscuribacterales bacterium]